MMKSMILTASAIIICNPIICCHFADAWSRLTTAPRLSRHEFVSIRKFRQTKLRVSSTATLEFQRDHGRGEDHLSGFLQEGDVVVYQTGTWFVDGVEVGNGRPPTFEWAKIDTLQIVFSHNCEHGVLRAIALKEENDASQKFAKVCENVPMEFVEFGPEQLVARVSVEWDDEEERRGTTNVPIVHGKTNSFWMAETGQG